MSPLKRIIKSILKYQTSSILTLLSLVISFVGIIILTLYVSFEKSFDQFHLNASSIYRLETREYGASVPAVISNIIQKNVPEIESQCVFSFWEGKVTTTELQQANTRFQTTMLYAENSFFDVFSFPLLIGSQTTALRDPNTVVLTQSFSEKLFGQSNPLGENVMIDNTVYKVTGVMKDFPENSSFKADGIPSFATYLKDNRHGVNEWSEWNYNIFIKLRPESNPVHVARKIELVPDITSAVKDMKAQHGNQPFVYLLPLNKIHFVSDGPYAYANPVILNILFLLSVILAIMGAVNFVNFSTSQAPLRAKALSILQVLGGSRLSSKGQIIAESVFLSVVALMMSFILYRLTYSSIEIFFGINGLAFNGQYGTVLGFFLFAIGFGVLAGLYPSHYITSSPIAQSIKGNAHFSGKGRVFRNTLVTIQFIFTIVMIVSAFAIEKQLNFWKNFDIGINKEHVVYLKTSIELQNHDQAFADELTINRDIVDYTYSLFVPGDVGMEWGREVDGQYIQLTCWPVDDRFLDFFGIKMTEGRKFRKGSRADINTFILNEKAVEKFGWKNSVERKITGFDFTGQVIGVAANFNFSSLKEDVAPMQFWLTDTRKNHLLLKIRPENYTQTLAYIESTAKKFDPRNPVEVKFLDNTLNKLYDREEKIARFIGFVALWCVLLAVTGLLGLIIFICRDRIKEIGIRKVNGAKVLEVVTMLNRDLLQWIVVAFIIAIPIAWYSMHRWLESFAYKTTLSWWIFAIAGLLSLGIALFTVSWLSWRAATCNPVEALRYE